MLTVTGLGVRYGTAEILRDVSFTVQPGQWLMVVGPNGAGKSTLVGAVAQGLPYTGTALFNGQDIAGMKASYRARCLGMLMQSHHVSYSFTVEEVVRLGRYSYAGGLFRPGGEQDGRAVDEALAATGLLKKRRQSVLALSGGELQRVFLAQLLAQDPALLLLDEPANHLDLPYQRGVFGLIGKWKDREGRAAVSVVHDLSLAKAYGTHAMLLHQGRVAALGPIGEVLTRENLQAVYGMDVADWFRGLLAQWQ